MIDKTGPVKNPLTIIAIFAAITEVSGTVVLPLLSSNNQNIFVWFLMLFPTGLVLLFFITLNYNHSVLYAPSDYTDETNFIAALGTKDQYSETAKEDFKNLTSELPDLVSIGTKGFTEYPPLKHGG